MNVVVDTSSLLAVVLGEDDAERHLTALRAHAGDLLLSAASLVEAGIVVEARQGPEATQDLQRLIALTGLTVVALDADQATLAVAAWRRFGRGRHPAALDLGDCFSYALAKASGAALLYKGDDFSQTDVTSALDLS